MSGRWLAFPAGLPHDFTFSHTGISQLMDFDIDLPRMDGQHGHGGFDGAVLVGMQWTIKVMTGRGDDFQAIEHGGYL